MTKAELLKQLEKYPDSANVTVHIDRKSRSHNLYFFMYSEKHNEITIGFPKTADADFIAKQRKTWKAEML